MSRHIAASEGGVTGYIRALLARVDAAAKRKGISRTAWVHWVVAEHLGEGD
jgi:hypothetical protein